jgi:ATP-binding cassette, subfamily B, bacterial MsbA
LTLLTPVVKGIFRGRLVDLKRVYVLKRTLSYIKQYRYVVAFALLCMAVFSILNGLKPFLLNTIANVIEKKDSDIDIIRRMSERIFNIREWGIWHVAVSLFALSVLIGIFQFLQRYLMGWAAKSVVRNIRDDLYRQFHRLSVAFFARSRTGELISRVTNDMTTFEYALSNLMMESIAEPLCLILPLIAAFYIKWQLALITFVLFPALALPIIVFGRKVKQDVGKIQSLYANVTSILHETFSGIRVVKAFNMEDYEIGKFAAENKRLRDANIRNVRNLNIVKPIIEVLGGLAVAGVFIVGAAWLKMSLADILTFSAALLLIYEPAKKISGLNNMYKTGAAAAERIYEILEMQPNIQDASDAKTLPTLEKEIAFNDVTFAYETANVLKNISFKIRKGEVIALVGPSGGGKTTVVNLLLRFYDPSSGSITIDGTDIRQVTASSLRRQIGIVTQDIVLFNDTVKANIAYGMPETSDADIIGAAKAANAHDFIVSLPDSYNAIIGEMGVKLSGGQKQRLAIARAILKNPAILILDEATSSLDTESERLVQQAISRMMENRTVLAIAHRLSTIRHADRILVIDRGEIVESGTHDALVRANGLYKKLYDMQFRDGSENDVA